MCFAAPHAKPPPLAIFVFSTHVASVRTPANRWQGLWDQEGTQLAQQSSPIFGGCKNWLDRPMYVFFYVFSHVVLNIYSRIDLGPLSSGSNNLCGP